jgi:hypothetical protein
MREYNVISEPVSGGEIAREAVRDELSRILGSSIFVQSGRLCRFLRYTVETTLAGGAESLKEYSIGTEVYERKPPYHPSTDSIVRGEARRLRNKLRQYYESAGKNDPVFIYYRTGSYVPAFRHNRADNRMLAPTHRTLNELFAEGLITQTLDLSPADRNLEFQIIFEGTVRIVRSESAAAATAPCASAKNIFGPCPTPKVVSVPAANSLRLRVPRSARLHQAEQTYLT